MNILKIIWFAACITFISSCCDMNGKDTAEAKADTKPYQQLIINPDTTIYIVLTDTVREQLITKGKQIAIQAKVKIKQALMKAMSEGGLENALEYCNVNALAITDSVSVLEKAQIRRIAKKNRNPLNEMNETESRIYKDYVINWLSKSYMYPMIAIDENMHPVYYDPMLVESLCLNCHGSPGTDITPGLAAKIAKLYPADKAIDFKDGDIRGMWAITFPQYIVTDVK